MGSIGRKVKRLKSIDLLSYFLDLESQNNQWKEEDVGEK